MIDIQHLAFGYEKKKFLYKDFSLSAASGKIYGLLGKNGAGKSTLLKNLSGLLFPASGHITVNGYIPQKRLPSFLETIYFITEEINLPALTVERYLDLYSSFYPGFSRTDCYDFMKMLEVTRTSKLNALSFGQQKKFIIAFALACHTSILLLDEPTNGLDIPSKAQFRRLVASVFSKDRMILISTHQIRDLDNLIDHVIIVDSGDLLLSASLENIGSKLHFTSVPEIPEPSAGLFFAEESIRGVDVILVNNSQEESKINLEHLFNAVIAQPVMAKSIFNS